ncbi:MAG TPA: hypothetical protein VJQ09_07670 [Candidatus Limnocylindria bacterium]|nr:hypothetical protein [Candidatus Limnocylindria bacterium]
MAVIGELTERCQDVVPPTLVLERAADRRGDETAALSPSDPAIDLAHQTFVEANVQTHGHTLAHKMAKIGSTSYLYRHG